MTLLSNILKILENLKLCVYKLLYTFRNINNITNNLQFSFRQHYSTSHVLINITENIRKALDDGNIGFGIFVILQKAFGTVDQDSISKIESLWDLWSFK